MEDELQREIQAHLVRLAELKGKLDAVKEHQQELQARRIEIRLAELLGIVTEHSRTSCSDENPCNSFARAGRVRCERCELLEAHANDHWPRERTLRIVIE